MTMSAYIPTQNVNNIMRKLKQAKIPTAQINAVLLKTAQETRDNMVNRITRGISSDNKKFKDYSPSYAKKRAKKGRNLKTDRLIYTGNMLANYQAQQVASNLIVIAFTNDLEEKKAMGNQRYYNQFPTTTNEAKKARKALIVNLSLLLRKRLA